jgi:hypothetical protein
MLRYARRWTNSHHANTERLPPAASLQSDPGNLIKNKDTDTSIQTNGADEMLEQCGLLHHCFAQLMMAPRISCTRNILHQKTNSLPKP